MTSARLLLAALALVACDEKQAPARPPAGRVVAVGAKPADERSSGLCDVKPEGASAPSFTLPPLDERPGEVRGARWVNVWATWCPPCVEELPLLTRAAAELRRSGIDVTLWLVSIDATAQAVRDFARERPEAKDSLRVSEPAALEPWLTSIGLDRGATLPVHVLVGTDGKVRCTRTGAITESDLPAIKAIFAGR